MKNAETIPTTSLPATDVALARVLRVSLRSLWFGIVSRGPNKDQSHLYRRKEIPKAGGKVRVLHVPQHPVNMLQKRILKYALNPFTEELWEGAPWVSAYAKRRSVYDCAEQHVGCAVKLSMDIENFFGTTSQQMVRGALIAVLDYPRSTASMIATLATMRREDGSRQILPQGASTSPTLANLVAYQRIDLRLLRWLHHNFGEDAVVYTRYSDNLEVSFREPLGEKDVERVQDAMRQCINRADYRVNHAKTRVQRHNSPTQRMAVLGLTVNEKLNMPKARYRQLRAIVHQADSWWNDRHPLDERLVALGRAGLCGRDEAVALLERAGLLHSRLEHAKYVLECRIRYYQAVAPERVAYLLKELEENTPPME